MNTAIFRRSVQVIVWVVLFGAVTPWAQEATKKAGSKNSNPGTNMKIVVTSVMVSDQAKALSFYTDILGFVKKEDVPVGQDRWLTVVSPEQPDGPELLLEPMGFPPAKVYQKALFDAGIPLTSFAVADIAATTKGCRSWVVFRTPPTKAGPVIIAVFGDTCGTSSRSRRWPRFSGKPGDCTVEDVEGCILSGCSSHGIPEAESNAASTVWAFSKPHNRRSPNYLPGSDHSSTEQRFLSIRMFVDLLLVAPHRPRQPNESSAPGKQPGATKVCEEMNKIPGDEMRPVTSPQ
jgi:catechol 2,3-dioxygenase-like lactoylglutathione lyase family enzyme